MYGNAQVRVSVHNGKIVEVQALELQGNDAVSGATFTSDSYIQSLQSALGKLGFTGGSA